VARSDGIYWDIILDQVEEKYAVSSLWTDEIGHFNC
jgi:hypothetical protein